ncbi:MAG: arylamine N-acetyltransferase [Pseudonocardiales bacterium]|nr:arylamine N-acetyltransferase [Pseudonocardiales bacterium]
MHAAHICSVPFEDYDIHGGVPISLDLDDLYDKIVRRRRGGFCYELNGLFGALLRALGHDVTLVSAFSLDDDAVRGPDFDHLRLIVDSTWIADVGNGAWWRGPVPLQPGEHGGIRVEQKGELWLTCSRDRDSRWQRDWAWTPAPRALSDFLDRCRYHEHNPESHFVQRRLASLAVDGGQITLVNGVFADTGRPDRLVSVDEERALLAERFGIEIDALIAQSGT